MKAQGYTKETIMNTGATAGTFPQFNVGDTIAVYQRIKEGDKERVQLFQGDVLAIKHGREGVSGTFTVRKIGAHGIAVERIIPFHSPLLKEIKVIKRGDVRRAKLYYIRKRVGRAARLKEKREHKTNTAAAETKQAVTSSHTASQEQMSAKSSK